MINPWVIVGVLVLWLASLAAVGNWQNEAGHTAERADWQGRANTELATANQRILALEEKYRKAEQDWTTQFAAIDAQHQKENQDATNITNNLIAAARAGSVGLRDPGARTHAAGGNPTAQTSTAASRCNAAGDGRLSADATEFLLSLTGRCNAVRIKLTACQAIVRADRIFSSSP